MTKDDEKGKYPPIDEIELRRAVGAKFQADAEALFIGVAWVCNRCGHYNDDVDECEGCNMEHHNNQREVE